MNKKAKKGSGKSKLEQFSKEMRDKINSLQLSKIIKVDPNDIDADFAALAKHKKRLIT
jgi:NADH/NAD ratio-sensing transcriptional regulator Rex